MLRFLVRLVLLLVGVAVAAVAAFTYWALRPLPLPAERVDFTIATGTSMRDIAVEMQAAGIDVHPELFAALSRVGGFDTAVKAGSYEVTSSDSVWRLLQRMAQGDVTYSRVTLIEGWTYRQIRRALAAHADVRQTLDRVDDATLLANLGASASHPEGLFFPDTYTFAKGSTDFDILRRAWVAQTQQLEKAWSSRDPALPLSSSYELLIMASIIEKETGLEGDRKRVAGVFANRLRVGMPLQTDPTVIYGMGDAYDGRLLRRHLQTDTPWNTYTRGGLPPTPIASPGRASLLAAAQPEKHGYFYFVSRGDGSSAFAPDLDTHNRYVQRYLRGGGQP